jgi:hypothetical protein
MKYATEMDHPPYSPDLVLLRFLALSKIRNALKGQRFADIPGIHYTMTLLQGTPENDFEDCFRQ